MNIYAIVIMKLHVYIYGLASHILQDSLHHPDSKLFLYP